MKRIRPDQSFMQRSAQINDNFLGQANPTLIEALIAEVEDEIAYREGRIPNPVDPPEPRPLTKEEWPSRNYVMVQRWRHRTLAQLEQNPSLIWEWYSQDPVRFICHWCDVYEPRNAAKGVPTRMPFILFQRQAELIQFFHACVLGDGNGLVEKARDMGATWCGVAYSTWMWLFVPGATVGWGSATAGKLDRLGDASSIFEKIRLTIRGLPKVFLPHKFSEKKHLMHQRILNPQNGNSIIGDVGDNIGRGGRTRVYFVDEAAYLEHPEAVEAALSETTRVRIDISSVSAPGTIFHRTRQSGVEWKVGGEIYRDRANVFLLDWRDHPEKTEEWAAQRKAHYESKGLGHIYAREIERDYAATQTGTIIKPEWFDAACNAHKVLGLVDEFQAGKSSAALDVADGGAAVNACTVVKHRLLKVVEFWHARDIAITARKAITLVRPFAPIDLQYDCIGIGAGVKGEANRLADMGLMPDGVRLIPWRAGDPVLDPHEKIVKNDPKAPTNHQFFLNLRAQAWWHLGRLFHNTYRAVREGEKFDVDEMIAIDTESIDITTLHKLRDELVQVTASAATAKLKMGIDKQPEGAPSPNLADALVMAMFPMPSTAPGSVSMFGAPILVRG